MAGISTARAASEVWSSTISRIPTLFGRLIFLASLYNPDTGRYHHPSLSDLVGGEDADRALRNSHQQVFQQWISSGLAEQKADLEEYLSASGGPRHARPYRHLAPATARDVERQLYLTDLETLLELLRFEPDAASPSLET